jgi:RND superfamily putative drug exporter
MLPAQSRAVRAQVSLAEMPGLNDLEDSLSVEQHVAERISALDFRLWISRARVARVLDAVDTAVRAASGDAVRLDRKMLVADLTPVERKVLGIALAMVGTPAVVIVDDVDELRTAAERADLWRALAWLTEEFTDPDGRPVTVVASCQDAAEPAAAVPPERLQLFDLTGVHPESDRSTLEKVR